MSPRVSRAAFPAALAAVLALGSLGCNVPNYNYGPGGGIVGLLILICWIVAIVQIIQSGKDSTSKLIWILVVLFLPIIGTILWFIIGRK